MSEDRIRELLDEYRRECAALAADDLRELACVKCRRAGHNLRGRRHDACSYWFAAATNVERSLR